MHTSFSLLFNFTEPITGHIGNIDGWRNTKGKVNSSSNKVSKGSSQKGMVNRLHSVTQSAFLAAYQFQLAKVSFMSITL
jgi:hypothetical protein